MIHVQVQPERVKRLNIAAVDMSLRRLAARRALVRRFRFEEGNDRGRYMNFNFTTAKPAALWEALRAGPFRSALLRSAAMVLCEGENGWDDYLCFITGTVGESSIHLRLPLGMKSNEDASSVPAIRANQFSRQIRSPRRSLG